MISFNPFLVSTLSSFDRKLAEDYKEKNHRDWTKLYAKAINECENISQALHTDIAYLQTIRSLKWISDWDYERLVVASLFFRRTKKAGVYLSVNKYIMFDEFFTDDHEGRIDCTGKYVLIYRVDYEHFWKHFVEVSI